MQQKQIKKSWTQTENKRYLQQKEVLLHGSVSVEIGAILQILV